MGGLSVLKDWLNKRAVAFTAEAHAFGLPAPKGVLLLGVQGCGKSLCAKAVSRLWQLPLLRFDMGRMFGSLVGSSEENVRRAIAVAESIAPAVLWVDEIDKAFTGSQSSGVTDGGTTARVFGTFLTWLSEKSAPVFVVATANDVSQLPPELLRKGRLDEIFYVDLPLDEERAEIFRIHLAKRNRNPEEFDLPALVGGEPGIQRRRDRGGDHQRALRRLLREAGIGHGACARRPEPNRAAGQDDGREDHRAAQLGHRPRPQRQRRPPNVGAGVPPVPGQLPPQRFLPRPHRRPLRQHRPHRADSTRTRPTGRIEMEFERGPKSVWRIDHKPGPLSGAAA